VNRPRTADRAARVGSLITTAAAGQTPFDYDSEMRNNTPGVNAAYNKANMYNQLDHKLVLLTLLLLMAVAGLINSFRAGGGGGGNDSVLLDWAKWNAQQESDAATSAASLRALQGLQGRLASGGYRGNADTLLGLDRYSETNRVKLPFRVNTTLVLETLTLDTTLAQGMINTGYGDLNKYLNANQIDPYANLQQQVSPVNNAMADYLSAYGVSNDPVNQQVQASQMANQEGANSFNQLQQLMSANQLANNQSNLGVSQAAQNYATTGLGTQRAGYLANAECCTYECHESVDGPNQSGSLWC
jgi:hypothetical protein